MLSRMHQRLGTAGFVIAIIALVAAMTGGAYAALTPADKRVVKKEAKKFSKKFSKQFAKPGPAGAPGAQGPKGDTGAAGTNGTNGTNGADGADGTDGTDGTDGKNGNSVVLTNEAAGANCADGGVKVEVQNTVGSTKYVCNGETGFTETLPPGETLKGRFGATPAQSLVTLSYNIPLADGKVPTFNVIKEDETALVGSVDNCPGTAADPEADPGNLCLYAQAENEVSSVNAFFETEEGITFSAGFLGVDGILIGSWAVTAPTS